MNRDHRLLDRDGHVLTVTLNRPEAKNALSSGMLAGMYRAWRMLDDDPGLRVAILTGRGDVFCAGADLKSMGAGETDDEFMQLMSEVPDIHWQALLRHNRNVDVSLPTEVVNQREVETLGDNIEVHSRRSGVARRCRARQPVNDNRGRDEQVRKRPREARPLLAGRDASAVARCSRDHDIISVCLEKNSKRAGDEDAVLDDEDAFRHYSFAFETGSVKKKRLPRPSSLSIFADPP